MEDWKHRYTLPHERAVPPISASSIQFGFFPHKFRLCGGARVRPSSEQGKDSTTQSAHLAATTARIK